MVQRDAASNPKWQLSGHGRRDGKKSWIYQHDLERKHMCGYSLETVEGQEVPERKWRQPSSQPVGTWPRLLWKTKAQRLHNGTRQFACQQSLPKSRKGNQELGQGESCCTKTCIGPPCQLNSQLPRRHSSEIGHHLPYNPDLVLCDIFLFTMAKGNLRGQLFLIPEAAVTA